ncbi:MAG: hypothetical protein HOY71_34850 [Nonomuraea sp.]|nr:hypothetical protein [Nonomuraea sp.]
MPTLDELDARTLNLREDIKVLNDEVCKILVTQEKHTSTLRSHSRKLDEHTKILQEHTEILDGHTKTLNKHTRMFEALFAHLGIPLPEEDVPAQN